jgi:hypothetical protein
MTRTSAVILQALIIAIFISSMIFFSLAISRESNAMPTMHSYEAMSVPGLRAFAEDTMERMPNEASFDPPAGLALASHDQEIMPPCDEGDDDDSL